MRKFLVVTCSLLFGLVAMFFAGMAIPHPSAWFGGEPKDCPTQPVYLISNGVHTDIAFKREDIANHPIYHQLFQDVDSIPEDSIIGFGWGERIFYLEVKEWEDLTFGKAWEAILDSPGSLMHVSAYPRKIADAKTEICERAWLQLIESITSSFAADENSGFERMPGYGAFDWFYEAQGRYSPFYTCNSWTASHLRRVGITTPLLGQFADPIVWHFPDDGS